MRAWLVVLALVGGPAVAQQPTAAQRAEFEALAAIVEPRDWSYVADAILGDGGVAVIYSQKGPPAPAYRRTWFRYEYGRARQSGGRTHRSTAFLQETDCAQRRRRIVQGAYYELNNMGGRIDELTGLEAWEFGVPGSLTAGTIARACDPA